ncbi:hypothetical protein SRB17_89800 [Streptomyces sp. RB17]|nr:hypothetical protein [Streptomyces sp. RB17]
MRGQPRNKPRRLDADRGYAFDKASLRSRCSSSRSAVVSSPGAPCPPSIVSYLTQFRSPSALIPISRATSVTVFPEERTSATPSRLNSSVYRLLRLLLLPTWHYFLWNPQWLLSFRS